MLASKRWLCWRQLPETVNLTLMHEGNNVREFYSQLPRPVLVGIEATGSMHWFLNLMAELGIECRVGHPAQIRAAEPRKQKHDRRDADLILKLLAEDRFPHSPGIFQWRTSAARWSDQARESVVAVSVG